MSYWFTCINGTTTRSGFILCDIFKFSSSYFDYVYLWNWLKKQYLTEIEYHDHQNVGVKNCHGIIRVNQQLDNSPEVYTKYDDDAAWYKMISLI